MWEKGVYGIVISALFTFILHRLGFDEKSFAAPLEFFVQYFEIALLFLFGWAEPYLLPLITSVGDLFGWPLQLYPHWKHYFFLMMMLCVPYIKIAIHFATNWKYRALRFYHTIGFTTLNLVSAIVVGLVPFDYFNSWIGVLIPIFVLANLAFINFILQLVLVTPSRIFRGGSFIASHFRRSGTFNQ